MYLPRYCNSIFITLPPRPVTAFDWLTSLLPRLHGDFDDTESGARPTVPVPLLVYQAVLASGHRPLCLAK